jgi:hypothetical protein
LKKLTVEDLLYMEKCAQEFNILSGKTPFDKSDITSQVKYTLEEIKEGVLADQENDKVEELDAICDSIVTGFYLNGLVSGKGFCPTWVKFLLDTHSAPTTDWGVLVSNLEKGKYSLFSTQLMSKVIELSYKYDIVGAYNRVTESNLSKFTDLSLFPTEVDILKQLDYIESQGRYGDLTYEIVGDKVVFKAYWDVREGVHFDKPKTIKPDSFKSVEDLGGLEEFIY